METNERLVDLVRPYLWTYLSRSAAAAPVGDQGLRPFPMADADLSALLAGHLALSDIFPSFLDAAEAVIARLPGRSSRIEVELSGEVEGDVNWPRTFTRRIETGDRTVFVSNPTTRRWDSAQARVLRAGLEAVLRVEFMASEIAGLRIGESTVLGDRARRLMATRKMASVRPVERIPDEMLARMEAKPSMDVICRMVRWVKRGVEELQPAEVNEILEATLLAPSEQFRLLELLTGFRIVEGLQRTGMRVVTVQAIAGSGRPFATLMHSEGEVRLYWQASLSTAISYGDSLYRTVRAQAALPAGRLVPDFVIVFPSGAVVIVEVKWSLAPEKETAVRRGLVDAMAYLLDTPDVFKGSPTPHALVVALGTRGRPNVNGPIAVTSEDGILDAMELVVAQHLPALAA